MGIYEEVEEKAKAIGRFVEVLRAELDRLKSETLRAMDEWDYEKAAEFRESAQFIEKILEPGTIHTADAIKNKKGSGRK